MTPLLMAAERGQLSVLQALVEAGADFKAICSSRRNEGKTALHLAAASKASPELRFAIVEYLLGLGLDPNAYARCGNVPLCSAASADITRLLIAHGADARASEAGLTPLHCAKSGEQALVLIEHGADVGAVAPLLGSPLGTAHEVDVMAVLMDNGGSIHGEGLCGKPAWADCIGAGAAAVNLLVAHGLSLDERDESGRTPLHWAVAHRNVEAVTTLLGLRADVDARDSAGRTPLFECGLADFRGDGRLAALALFAGGASADVQDDKGKRPLDEWPLDEASAPTPPVDNPDEHPTQALPASETQEVTADPLGKLATHARAQLERIGQALVHEAKRGDDDALVYLLAGAAGLPPLAYAIAQRDLETAAELLRMGANPNQTVGDTPPPIVLAVYNQDTEAVRLLLRHRAAVNVAWLGYWPLIMAAILANAELADLLIRAGAHPHVTDERGWQALHTAALNGSEQIGMLLLARGVNPLAETPDGWTPLHVAALADQADFMVRMARCGANINTATRIGVTPLHLASHLGNFRSVGALLRLGADLNAVAWDSLCNEDLNSIQKARDHSLEYALLRLGYTPVHFAAAAGHTSVLGLLTAGGASPTGGTHPVPNDGHDWDDTEDSYDCWGCRCESFSLGPAECTLPDCLSEHPGAYLPTPLHLALACGHLDVATMLLDSGADVNAATPPGRTVAPTFTFLPSVATPLHWAVRTGSTEMVKLLAQRGADVNAAAADTGRWPETALALALRGRDYTMARLLLDLGASPDDWHDYGSYTRYDDYNPYDGCEPSGAGPLHWAAAEGDTEAVQLLIEYGAVVDTDMDEHGVPTPLCLAAAERHWSVVQVLLQHGANPLFECADGITPLDAASDEVGELMVLERLAAWEQWDRWDWSPLHHACHAGSVDEVASLLSGEAHQDVATGTCEGGQALRIAAAMGIPDVVRALLGNGAEATAPDELGFTAIHYAAITGMGESLHLLLSEVQEMPVARYGLTPLHCAAYTGQVNSAAVLLLVGASAGATTAAGHVPADFSRMRGSRELTALLQASVSLA